MATEAFGDFVDSNGAGSSYNPGQQGVFGLNPLATPKYALNDGARDAEFRNTLARLYISLADMGDAQISAYLATLPQDGATQALAQVLLGANSKGGTGFVDFFLTVANEPFQEIMQVDKVMSDDYVAFFYGTQPPQFQYSGMLLNSLQDDQRSGFARAYQQMLRGTQLARRGALARLRYASVIVSGVMTAQQQTLNAENEMAVPFNFTFLVKEYVVVTNLPFAKLTSAAYVKLAADAAVTALQAAPATGSAQVNTTVATPPNPAGASAAGVPQNTTVVNTHQNAMQQTKAAGQAVNVPPSPTSNVYGTISPDPPTPPSPA
jgi:hypothetical protein